MAPNVSPLPHTGGMTHMQGPAPQKKPFYLRVWFWALIVVGATLLGLMSALSGDPAPTAESTPSVEATDQQSPEPKADKPDGCTKVSTDTTQAILDGAPEGITYKAEGDAYAIQSETGDWFIAIRFTHDAGTDTGVWQAKALDGGPYGSVDAFAKEYTQWPDTGNAGAEAADRAEACLK